MSVLSIDRRSHYPTGRLTRDWERHSIECPVRGGDVRDKGYEKLFNDPSDIRTR